MIQKVHLYSNGRLEHINSAVILLNRIQDRLLFLNSEELSLENLGIKPTMLVDFDEFIKKFSNFVLHKNNPISLYLLSFGVLKSRIITSANEGVICLEGINEEIAPFVTAFYLFKTCVRLAFETSCPSNNCILSLEKPDYDNIATEICGDCQKYLDITEKTILIEKSSWFKELFLRIRTDSLKKKELDNIISLPRELIHDFNLNCREPVCFIKYHDIKERVRIALVQIKVPFDEELQQEFGDKGLYNKWINDGEHQAKKIANILNFLIENESIDIVVFPELAVPPSFQSNIYNPALRSRSLKIPIIIAGAHYMRDPIKKVNYEGTPIIFPCGGSVISFSKFPSRHEAHSNPLCTYIQNNPIWVIEGSFNNIGVVICKDFFHVEELYEKHVFNRISLLVCVMSDSNVMAHYEKAKGLSREKFIVLVNTVGKHGCGNSALFGPVNKKHLSDQWENDSYNRIFGLLKDSEMEESVIIGTFDLRYPYIEKVDRTQTNITRDNYSNFYDPKILFFDDAGQIKI